MLPPSPLSTLGPWEENFKLLFHYDVILAREGLKIPEEGGLFEYLLWVFRKEML